MASTSFTAVGDGAQILVDYGGYVTYALSGTFVATMQLVWSQDGGKSWTVILSATAAASGTYLLETANRDRALVMWRCTAFTSGTAVTAVNGGRSAVGGYPAYLGEMFFSQLPPAGSVAPGTEVRVRDFTPFVKLASNGSYWRPTNGTALLLAQTAVATTTANSSEQLITGLQLQFPANFLQVGCIITTYFTAMKSATSETCTVRFRMGADGSTLSNDAALASPTLATTSDSGGIIQKFWVESASTIRKLGNGQAASGWTGTATTDVPAAVTLSSSKTIADALYFEITSQMSTGAETISVYGVTIEVSFP